MRVAVLIVTYNRLLKLQQVLRMTLAQDFHTVMVVNNAATDGTAAWLGLQDDPRLRVLTLPANAGGAGGFSAGLAALAGEPGWTHVCLGDDDAWPAPDWLAALSREPEADAYSSDVRRPDGQSCPMNLPFTRVPATLWQTLRYAVSPGVFRPAGVLTRVESLSFVGACVSRDWLSPLRAALDERLFLYYDDLIAGAALARQGARLVWSPALRYFHDVTPDGRVPARKRYYLTRNLLWLHRSSAGSPWTPTVTLLRLALQFYAALQDRPCRPALRAWASGIRDGLRPLAAREKQQPE